MSRFYGIKRDWQFVFRTIAIAYTTPHFGFVISIASENFYITLCLLI